MKIFVSYTTRDNFISFRFLNELNNFLSDFGQVYIDLIHNDSRNKQERVLIELGSSDLILLIKTQGIFKSEWVQIELSKALSLGKKVIIINFNILKELIRTQDINKKVTIRNYSNPWFSV